MLRRFLGENSISTKGLFVLSILFVSVFGWYFMAGPLINQILKGLDVGYEENLVIWATFYVSIILSSIVGAYLSNRVDRLRFLYFWTILGVIVSFLPCLLTDVTVLQICILCLLLGASFGVGMPSCLAYFSECTLVENRGRIGGITFLIANISALPLSVSVITLDLATISVIFALLRSLGLIVFFLKPEKQQSQMSSQNVSFFSILGDRRFLLYFIVWFMFPLVDRFEKALLEEFLNDLYPNLLAFMGNFVEPLVAGCSILIAGLLCDWIGRKKIVLTGFVALGVAYAIIGFASESVLSWYIYFIVDGVAWGIFLLMFVLILWGDLAQSDNSEKYYTLGSIPFFLSSIIPLLLTQSFIENIEVFAAFSLASFFLFAAVMPLMFAPETLPEKKMELRRLRSFAEEARKAKEKYEQKTQK